MTPDKDVDRLYGLPLAEFTAERDALAKRLRKDGDRDAADEVKALKKPSEPAWAVNQLARKNKCELNALLKAGERLRDAQTGGAGRDELRAAIAAEREQVGKLSLLAEPLLDPASEAKLERVRNTLHALAADEHTREQVEAGRLVADAEAVGLGLPGLAAAPSERESKAKPEPKQKPESKEKPKAKEKPKRESRASAAANRKALRAIEMTRKRERDAREKADRARTELKRARAAAEDAARALQTAERRAKEAEARESDAQDKLEQAEANRPA